jgi:hypothetical protein
MAEYWKTNPKPSGQLSSPGSPSQPSLDHDSEEPFMSEYDIHRLALLNESISNEDWQLELRRYLLDVPAEVTRDTDIVDWWSVSYSMAFNFGAYSNKLVVLGSCYALFYISPHRARCPPKSSIIRSM